MTKSTPAPAAASTQRPMRADARRNYDRLVATATDAFAERGADASLDDIARRAGVGSGTLYRHFPTRQALLEAVYREQVELLCAQASELLDAPSPADALETWLRAVTDYAATKRGLAAMMTNLDQDSELLSYCRDAMRSAGSALLDRAQRAGAVRSDVDLADLLKLLSVIGHSSVNSEGGRADRLIALVMDGLRHQPPPAPEP